MREIVRLTDDLCVDFGCQSEVCEPIIEMAVGATLDQNDFGSELLERVWDDSLEGFEVGFVSCIRRQWNVEFQSLGFSLSGFIRKACAWKEEFSTFSSEERRVGNE